MKPSLFKIAAVLALLTNSVTVQIKTVYQDILSTTEKSSLNLDLTNASVFIEISPKDQIEIDFRLEFENYTEKEI